MPFDLMVEEMRYAYGDIKAVIGICVLRIIPVLALKRRIQANLAVG
jgi:hypothetical protein